MTDKEIVTWLYALVGVVSAIAALQLSWPASLMFFVLGVGAAIMALATERS